MSQGISDWRELRAKMREIPHVVADAPVLYDPGIVLKGPAATILVVLKGIDKQAELETSDVLRKLKSGSLDDLGMDNGLPGIILGSNAAQDTGLSVGDVVDVVNPEGSLTPFASLPRTQRFRVAGIFESGFYNFDDQWAFASLEATQKLLSVGDVVNDIEIRGDDPALARDIARQAVQLAGNSYTSTNWEEQNSALFDALEVERLVTFVTIGLIELVAALNIFIALTMIVLTKFKDIAVLMTMGARRALVRRIFIMQGAMIGVTGTLIGLVVGYSLCYFAQRYHWVHLNATVYSLSFVPFEPRLVDGIWIAAAAIIVSLVATIYPARNATRITPVEVLRYE